jgi:AraC-like DNA-binding protein
MPIPGRYKTNVNRLLTVRYDLDCLTTMVVKPSIFFILQGFSFTELALFQTFTPPQSFLIIGPQLPMVVRIKATSEYPLIVMILHLDLDLLQAISSVMFHKSKQKSENYSESWVTYGNMDVTMNQMLLNLLNCQAKKDAPFELTPTEILDIYTYFLNLPQGALLQKMTSPHFMNLINSIYWANDRFYDPLSVTDLAKEANMSLTSYHRHFKSVITLSPLQYIKTIKLLEARRLMLFYGKSAIDASQFVGYESPSQFNREYKRFFTMPPHKEISYTLFYNKPIYQPLTLSHRF